MRLRLTDSRVCAAGEDTVLLTVCICAVTQQQHAKFFLVFVYSNVSLYLVFEGVVFEKSIFAALNIYLML